MVTLMPCSYLSAPRCGLIDKMLEPKVLWKHNFCIFRWKISLVAALARPQFGMSLVRVINDRQSEKFPDEIERKEIRSWSNVNHQMHSLAPSMSRLMSPCSGQHSPRTTFSVCASLSGRLRINFIVFFLYQDLNAVRRFYSSSPAINNTNKFIITICLLLIIELSKWWSRCDDHRGSEDVSNFRVHSGFSSLLLILVRFEISGHSARIRSQFSRNAFHRIENLLNRGLATRHVLPTTGKKTNRVTAKANLLVLPSAMCQFVIAHSGNSRSFDEGERNSRVSTLWRRC